MNSVQTITISLLSLLLAGGGLAAAGASLYDAAETERGRRLTRHPYIRALRRRPLISVIILAAQDNYGLLNCLNSLSTGVYRKYELIIITKNRNAIEATLKGFKTAHPSKTVIILSDGPKSLQKALKIAKGELLTVLDEPVLLEKTALKLAADRFALNPSTNTVLIEPVIAAEPSLINLSYRFKAAAGAQFRKAAAAYGLASLSGRPAIYRRLYLEHHPRLNQRIIRLASQIAMLAALSLGAYGIYLAVASVTAYLLAILWGSLLLFLALAIWSDRKLQPIQKLRMLLLAPAVTGLLYLNLLFNVLKSTAKLVKF